MTARVISLARYRHQRYPAPARGGNCLSAAVLAAIPILVLLGWLIARVL